MNINVVTDRRGSTKGWWAGDKGGDGGGRRMGGWDQGVCVRLVYPAGGPRDPDRALMSPTVPYPPNSPTSCSRWSDVTGQLGMSRPTPPPHSLSPSPLSPLPTRLQSLASHCDPAQSMEHVPNTDRKANMQTLGTDTNTYVHASL